VLSYQRLQRHLSPRDPTRPQSTDLEILTGVVRAGVAAPTIMTVSPVSINLEND